MLRRNPGLLTTDIVESLAADDFLFVDSELAVRILSDIMATPVGDDPVFLDSWSRLEQDQYMADGGRYRKRRHATYTIDGAGQQARLMPYQPHYQTVDYNPLNGGVARYFAPILDDLHQSIRASRLRPYSNLATGYSARSPAIRIGISSYISFASRPGTDEWASLHLKACIGTGLILLSW